MGYTEAMIGCVQKVISLFNQCQTCLKSLVCCVTDSCNICNCECNHLIKFDAPISSPALQQHSWLFNGQCHFAFIGTPACQDCDGKHAYKSVNCSKEVYLHYHDYIIDGRWVITEDIDSNDNVAVLRNRGDGLDDEECPEKESFNWEYRSPQGPELKSLMDWNLYGLYQQLFGNWTLFGLDNASGWFKDTEIKLVPYQSQEDISVKASLIAKKEIVKLEDL